MLLGTQMVAKGHDFPDVDARCRARRRRTLRFPDFRAEERTFALIAQLAGRAGRGPHGGRVLVQTARPDAPAIAAAARHDADGFLAGELERRRALRYPPFADLIRVVVLGRAGRAGARRGGQVARAIAAGAGGDRGPRPAPLFRLRGRERRQVVVKTTDARGRDPRDSGRGRGRRARPRAARCGVLVDVDPQ